MLAWYSASMLSVKVSSKYQISLPSAVRRELGIAPGDRLSVEVVTDALILRPRADLPSDRLRGLGRQAWVGVEPVTYVRELREQTER